MFKRVEKHLEGSKKTSRGVRIGDINETHGIPRRLDHRALRRATGPLRVFKETIQIRFFLFLFLSTSGNGYYYYYFVSLQIVPFYFLCLSLSCSFFFFLFARRFNVHKLIRSIDFYIARVRNLIYDKNDARMLHAIHFNFFT